MRIHMTRYLFIATFILALTGSILANAQAPSQNIVKVGIAKGLLRDLNPQLFRVLATNFEKVMQAQTGLSGQLLSIDSANEITQRLMEGDLQLGVVHGVEFGWMKVIHPDIHTLMINDIDPELLRAVVVVARDSPAKSLKDCQGEKLAIPSGTRGDTRLFITQRCRQMGSNIQDMFPEVSAPASIETALDNLVDGIEQVAVVERAGLKMFERRKPGRFAKLAVLEQSEPFPPSVIIFRRDKLDETTQTKFRDGMCTAHKSLLGAHLMTLMRIKRFEPVTADFHKSIDETLKAYPKPESLPQLPRKPGH